jgi:hypothetical protein
MRWAKLLPWPKVIGLGESLRVGAFIELINELIKNEYEYILLRNSCGQNRSISER